MVQDPECAGWQDRSDVLGPSRGTQPVVYRVRNTRGEIIYIGMTTQRLENRFAWHKSRNSTGGRAPWWKYAASVEALPVPENEVRAAESTEIHRWHPTYNKRCAICGKYRQQHKLYRTWLWFLREHQMHAPWHDLEAFTQDVANLIGERPDGRVFQLIDRSRICEPGNIYWGRKGRWP